MDEHAQPHRADQPPVGVVVSRYNRSITDALLAGAVAAHRQRRGEDPVIIDAPGAFELPALVSAAIESGRFDGVVALGCIVRGETEHDRVIAHAVAGALAHLSAQAVLPVGFGVLTVNTIEQAVARSGGPGGHGQGNKGADAMHAVLDSIDAIARLLDFADDLPGHVVLDRPLPDKGGPR